MLKLDVVDAVACFKQRFGLHYMKDDRGRSSASGVPHGEAASGPLSDLPRGAAGRIAEGA